MMVSFSLLVGFERVCVCTLKPCLDQVEWMQTEGRDYPCCYSGYGLHEGLREGIFASHETFCCLEVWLEICTFFLFLFFFE